MSAGSRLTGVMVMHYWIAASKESSIARAGHRFLWLSLVGMLWVVAAAAHADGDVVAGDAAADDVVADDVVDIGARRELFVDGLLIDKLSGARLKLHQPQPGGIAVKYDGPAEYPFCHYTTILKDGDRYRMYYRGGNPEDLKKSVTCYAESRDGITWTKPTLGLVEIDGSRENNAILPAGDQFCPFIDGRPGVSDSERYKANMLGEGGLLGYISADGIHWERLRPEPIVRSELFNNFDSQNSMFWSEAEQCYVLYARHMAAGRRAAARATSADFLNWTKQTLMSYSDTDSTTPSKHLYTNQTHPYFRAPHLYISMPGRFLDGRRALSDQQSQAVGVDDRGGGAKDISDGVLLTSRAGSTRYDFTFRESFVRPGIGDNNWTSRSNYPALGVVPTAADEMSFYVQRNYAQKNAHLERMTLRTDGFTSVNAPYDGGELLTKPLKFAGGELALNYATSAAGDIRVEIQDASGKPISGFTLDDCPEIIGDEISRIVSWKAGSDVKSLVGHPVRLRFVMHDADLYSFRFRPD